MNATTKTRSQKLIEQAGGHCGMIPKWEEFPEQWQTVKDPQTWIGVGGRRLDADECRAMVNAGELKHVRTDKMTGTIIYRLEGVTA